jgi:DNA-binding NtrC family response regulator
LATAGFRLTKPVYFGLNLPSKLFMPFRIFVVEDDAWYGEFLRYQLTLNPDYEVELITSGKQLLAQLHLNPDVICLDFSLPDMGGSQLLDRIISYNSELPVVIISGQEDISVAVNLLKSGARDYIVKGDNTRDLLWNSLLRIRENAALKKEVEVLKEQLEEKFSFQKSLIGQSSAIQRVASLVEKAARTDINVSVTGETGTGKELVAKAIHFSSRRSKMPFIAVNMAAIPKDLVESEFFGYEKGAFTGAASNKKGRFEEAQGGTLFLDEVSEMDIGLQSKILRVLQERELVRLGGNKLIRLDFRLISATQKNLQEEVKAGRFREDLYFRLIGLPLEMPALRTRGNDILLLARHFCDSFTQANKMRHIDIAEDARLKLLSHPYPGNVRELRAVVELAIVMSDGKTIHAEDISFMTLNPARNLMEKEKTLREYTCEIISFYLQRHHNNVVEVARKLGIGKSSIYQMIKDGEIVLQ